MLVDFSLMIGSNAFAISHMAYEIGRMDRIALLICLLLGLACLPAVWPAVRPLSWLALVFGLPFLLSRAALLLWVALLSFAHRSDAVAFFDQVRAARDDGVARFQSADDLDFVFLGQAGFEGDEFGFLRFDHIDSGLIAAIDERVAGEQRSFARASQVEFDAREHLPLKRPVAVGNFDLDKAVARLSVEQRGDAHDASGEALSGQAVDCDRHREAAFNARDVALGGPGLDDHRRGADYRDDRSSRIGHRARMRVAFGDQS